MAEAFLQVLLENLASFIVDKFVLLLLFGFEKEFEKLSSVFSTIQVVLQDAQEKQLKDKAIENWLQKLNSVAYEVDDILGECKNEATKFKQSRFGFYHPGIINFRHKIVKKMKDIMEKLDANAEERSKFHLLENIIERQATSTRKTVCKSVLYFLLTHSTELNCNKSFVSTLLGTGFVLIEPKVYGRDKEEDEIVKILINNVNVVQELPVFPIIGMGGLGKTTLAQMIFNDEKVTKHFNPKIWVCVSDDFDEKRLIKTIIGSIERSSPDVEDLASFQKKEAMLRAVLKVGSRGASILATTHLEKVGSIMGTSQPYHLSNLSPHDGLLLFMQRAFGQQREANPNLVAIGKEIVKKCGGVPLAAKTLGGLLHFKREESEWEHVRDNEIWSLRQDESSILPALRLSYHHLPLDLRQCFAYCAVFPKDTKMIKENLITLWMAHGFLLSKGNLELEDVGNERSFFQEIEVKSGKTYFKMHDLIHDLATSLFSASVSSSNICETTAKSYTHTMSIGFAEVVSSYSPSLLKKFVSLRRGYASFKICTLDLHNCYSLYCLPKQTSKLGSLRNLVLDGCPLTSTPPRIGLLTCLKTLGCFIVGSKKGYQPSELKNLNLYGSISITHLERVKNG
ncbi:hypothetical protein H5410_005500 [Solanum commersonii]|uniref:Uncharacterized protein n=1 Tax=Solanum commersonii TaxID=4109 RepID=A0A9J6A7H8_SOLCO|nr:hypothetical protein H5410_005500 [Solanum commersonii]